MNIPTMACQFDSNMLKEAGRPDAPAKAARPHRRGRSAAARRRRADGHSRRQGGEVHHHRRRRDPQLRRARLLDQASTPIPGQLNETWVKVDRPGVYFGQCSELCGARHGFMPIAVEVVPPGAVRPMGRVEGRRPCRRKPRPRHRSPPAARSAPPRRLPAIPATAARHDLPRPTRPRPRRTKRRTEQP